MRRYETVFILRSDLGEAQTKESIKRFETILATNGGQLLETDEWGMREMAYNIGRERHGYYVRMDYVADAGVVMNELERNLKLADNVLRHLSVMVEPDADADKLRSEIEAHHRRLAEARSAPAAAEAQARSPQTPEPPAENPAEQPTSSEPAGDGNPS